MHYCTDFLLTFPLSSARTKSITPNFWNNILHATTLYRLLISFSSNEHEKNQVTCDEQLQGQCKCKMHLRKDGKKFSCGWYANELVFQSHVHIKRLSTLFLLPSNYFCLWDRFPFMDSMQESLLTWGLCSVFHDLTCHSLRVIYGANQVKPIPSKFSKYASIYYQLQVLHGKKLLYGNQCNENFTVSLIHTAPPRSFFTDGM